MPAKSMGERDRIGIAGALGGLSDRHRAAGEQAGRAFEPQDAVIGDRRDSEGKLEMTGEMERRQTRDSGELLEADDPVGDAMKMGARALEPLA